MRSLIIATCFIISGPAAASVTVRAELANPTVLSGQANRAFIKVSVAAEESPKPSSRVPVNVALVLDKSGSMGGQKITEARRAAILAVQSLRADDIVSVVAYDSVVQVIVPATKAHDKDSIIRAINKVGAGGGTALFAGVSKGASELRKFLDGERVSRVVLLSDGLANIGPSSPGELAALGSSLAKDGIAVTTVGLGLGYNEDLMARLAGASDGNHAFAESANDLARIFSQEFGDLFAVTAQKVSVTMDCALGIRPLRVLGRDALIDGQRVTTRLGHLNGTQQKYVLIEVELPRLAHGTSRGVAKVLANYQTRDGELLTAKARLGVSASANATTVAKSVNRDVMVSVTEMMATEQNKRAIKLRDEGRLDEARKVLQKNSVFLRGRSKSLGSARLKRMNKRLEADQNEMKKGNWRKARKRMVKTTYEFESQQAY